MSLQPGLPSHGQRQPEHDPDQAYPAQVDAESDDAVDEDNGASQRITDAMRQHDGDDDLIDHFRPSPPSQS
jgi:hypothetical protein